MRRTVGWLAGLVLVASAAGCAALFNAKTTPVQMNSNPAGAEVLVDGTRVGETPMSVDLSNNQSHTVTFRIIGLTPVTCIINRKVGPTWVILDVLGGLVPIVIDAATGSWYELDKNVCNGTLSGGELDVSRLDPALQATYAGVY